MRHASTSKAGTHTKTFFPCVCNVWLVYHSQRMLAFFPPPAFQLEWATRVAFELSLYDIGYSQARYLRYDRVNSILLYNLAWLIEQWTLNRRMKWCYQPEGKFEETNKQQYCKCAANNFNLSLDTQRYEPLLIEHWTEWSDAANPRKSLNVYLHTTIYN